MRAVAYKQPQPISAETSLIDIDLPTPEAKGHDLLVEVKAVSVNPVDVKIRANVAPAEGCLLYTSHFFGSLGLGLGALAALILFWLFIDKFVFGDDIGSRPLLMVGVVLLLSSVQMITTGILAEMIARIYYRDDLSPNYIVRKIFDRNNQDA